MDFLIAAITFLRLLCIDNYESAPVNNLLWQLWTNLPPTELYRCRNAAVINANDEMNEV